MDRKEPTIKYVASRINKELLTKDASGNLVVRGLFTSDNKDMLGDVITRAATERAVPAFRQWGNIRYMHLPQPVGKVTRIGSGDGLSWNEVEFTVLKEDVAKDVENGLLPALSVGILVDFESLKFLDNGGWEINDYVLAEISLVDHPANYDAVLSRGITMEEIRMPKDGKVVVIDDELDTKDIAPTDTVADEADANVTVTDSGEATAAEVVVEVKGVDAEAEVEEEPVSEEVELVEEEAVEAETAPEAEDLPEASQEEPELEKEIAVEQPEDALEEALVEEAVLQEEPVVENAVEEEVFDVERAFTELLTEFKELTKVLHSLADNKAEESETEEAEMPSVEETKALDTDVVEEQEPDEVVNRGLDIQESVAEEVTPKTPTRREVLRGAIRHQLEKQGY